MNRRQHLIEKNNGTNIDSISPIKLNKSNHFKTHQFTRKSPRVAHRFSNAFPFNDIVQVRTSRSLSPQLI